MKATDGGYFQWRPYPHPGVTNGPWLAALGIVSGLFQAQMTGKGCYIDIACADGAFMAFSQEILSALNGGTYTDEPPEEPTSSKYTYYETKDGKFMLVAATERHLWEGFCDAIGRSDLKGRGDWGDDAHRPRQLARGRAGAAEGDHPDHEDEDPDGVDEDLQREAPRRGPLHEPERLSQQRVPEGAGDDRRTAPPRRPESW